MFKYTKIKRITSGTGNTKIGRARAKVRHCANVAVFWLVAFLILVAAVAVAILILKALVALTLIAVAIGIVVVLWLKAHHYDKTHRHA